MSDTTPPNGGDQIDLSAVDPTRSLRSTLRGVATVVAPASLVTALLYYFGWARTSHQARQMGLDDSLLGYSLQDYLLRSMSSLFTPLAVGVVAVLAGLAFHVALVSWAGRPTDDAGTDRRRMLLLRCLTGVLVAAAVVLLILGGLAARRSQPTRFVYLFGSIGVTLGIVFAGYAAHLRRRFLVGGDSAPSTPERNSLRVVSASLYLVLVFLSLFNAVSHYATVKGGDLAMEVARALPTFPDVTLYSGRQLFLQPPVEETALGQDDSSYRFRYTGLKFLFVSGNQYFLRPSDAEGSSLNIIIPKSPDLRLDLVLAEQ